MAAMLTRRQPNLTLALVATVCFAVVAGCSSGAASIAPSIAPSASGGTAATSTPTVQPSLGSLKLMQIPGILLTGTMQVALQEGFFKQHGLDVSLVNVTSGPAGFAAVKSGEVDLTPSNGDNFFGEVARGADMQVVAVGGGDQLQFVGRGTPQPYPGWMQQFRGKTVGVTAAGSSTYYWVLALIKAAGLTSQDVTLTQAANVSVPSLYKQGALDGYSAANPQAAQLVQLGAHVLQVFGDGTGPEGTIPQQVLWYGMRSWISSHGPQLQAFTAALKDAATFMKDPNNLTAIANDEATVEKIDVSTVPGGQSAWLDMVKAYAARSTDVDVQVPSLVAWLAYVQKYAPDLVSGTEWAGGDATQLITSHGIIWSGQ